MSNQRTTITPPTCAPSEPNPSHHNLYHCGYITKAPQTPLLRPLCRRRAISSRGLHEGHQQLQTFTPRTRGTPSSAQPPSECHPSLSTNHLQTPAKHRSRATVPNQLNSPPICCHKPPPPTLTFNHQNLYNTKPISSPFRQSATTATSHLIHFKPSPSHSKEAL